jgi:hypothetical protein
VVPAGALQAVSAQEMRALLTARKLLQGKRLDVEMSLRGVTMLRASVTVSPWSPPLLQRETMAKL